MANIVGYRGAHIRVKAVRGAPSEHQCPCGKVAEDWSYKGADPEELRDSKNRPYSLVVEFYEALCRKCHYLRDGYGAKRGEANALAVLTEDKVRKIRSSYPSKTQMQLAEEFNVSRWTVRAVLSGKTWTHVA